MQNQTNTNIKAPSQLYRMLVSEEIDGANNSINWDWKHLRSIIDSNEDLIKFKSKIKKIITGDLDLELRLKTFRTNPH